jgi:nucleoprotein TPR
MEENFRAELAAQTKLAALYEQHSKEGSGKTEELAGAIRELQGLLTEARERTGQLESEAAEVQAHHREELDRREEAVVALRKELEGGNKLIKTMREKGLSEDSIECLSPSAAQASRLLKSGITVTGIYSQMVALGEELAAEKAETQRLGLYIEQILHEIEERAPLLRQQREDYEKAVAAVGGLTESLESAREEVELRRGEAEEARRRLAGVERDRDRQGQQAADLGRQVATLVREVEASRSGSGRSASPARPLDATDVDSVIEGRLLTFRDVAELQERNIELVAVVRELSARHEAQETSLVEEKTAELRQELDTALRQVEELRAARERQQLMVESIIQQRDMYKSMASGPAAVTAPAALARTGDAAQEAKLVKELEEVKKDFAEYKVEKATNYKMLNNQQEKMRDELTEARTKAAKLGSQEVTPESHMICDPSIQPPTTL